MGLPVEDLEHSTGLPVGVEGKEQGRLAVVEAVELVAAGQETPEQRWLQPVEHSIAATADATGLVALPMSALAGQQAVGDVAADAVELQLHIRNWNSRRKKEWWKGLAAVDQLEDLRIDPVWTPPDRYKDTIAS